MKSNPIVVDQFLFVADELFPLFMILVFLMPIYRFTSWIVSDKMDKTKDVARSMGVRESSYWLSWFLFYVAGMTPVSLVCALLLTYGVLDYADLLPVFLMVWLYGLSLFGYIFLTSSFFTKPAIASIVSSLLYFITSFLDMLVASPYMSESKKLWASMLPQIAVRRAVATVLQFETKRRTLSVGAVGQTLQNYSMSNAYLMMLLSLIVFTVLGAYFTQILASSGMRKHPCFCLGARREQGKLLHLDIDDEKDA